jgi:hypothetical protein
MSDMDPELFDVFERLSCEPYFCGYRLARLRKEKGQTPEQQAADLGIPIQRLAFLALTRTPQCQADLEAIAWQLEMEPAKLADVIGGPHGATRAEP